jgi:hypothetical protein
MANCHPGSDPFNAGLGENGAPFDRRLQIIGDKPGEKGPAKLQGIVGLRNAALVRDGD